MALSRPARRRVSLRGCDPKLLTPPQFSTLGLPHQGPSPQDFLTKGVLGNWASSAGMFHNTVQRGLAVLVVCFTTASSEYSFLGTHRLELDHFHSPSFSTGAVLRTNCVSLPFGPGQAWTRTSRRMAEVPWRRVLW